MKELNLLPKNKRFDFKRYILLKNIKVFAILNIFVIIIITVALKILIKKEKRLILESQQTLNMISNLNERFIPYSKKLKEFQKEINYLQKSKNLYFINYHVKYSPFLSTLILLNTLSSGIKIIYLNYSNGAFNIIGFADKNKDFYNYYKRLKRDKNILNVDFYHLKKSKKKTFLTFKLQIKVKELY